MRRNVENYVQKLSEANSETLLAIVISRFANHVQKRSSRILDDMARGRVMKTIAEPSSDTVLRQLW